ncbi:MAG: ATP-dependent DNA helicase RecG [bacterium]|nr:ATP-dependent DNA helicase RecG [bacterium]
MTLATTVRALAGVGPAKARLLANLKIETVRDLLYWAPRKYVDCTNPQPIGELTVGSSVAVLAHVSQVAKRQTKSRKTIVSALLTDDSGSIEATWFNQPYLESTLKRTRQALFWGVVNRHWQTGLPILMAPKIETAPRVVPIYSTTTGLSSRQLNKMITTIVGQLVLPDPLEPTVRAQADVIELAKALSYLHEPVSMSDVAIAKRRLLFDELYVLQLRLAQAKKRLLQHQATSIKADAQLLKKFVGTLPFTLTDDQRQAVWQMALELNQTQPMHRLLNGDVGSGKTVVAVALMLLTVKSGHRAILMAPTEILVQQHRATITTLLNSFGVSIGLVTAGTKELDADILIGTHALLSKDVALPNVGLVVIDEQHRFGVRQRTLLRRRATEGRRAPHVLALTATPIPRSLALILFGDLDITVLHGLPAGRLPITTAVVQPTDEPQVYATMHAALARQEQIYVVCPLIEEQRGDELIVDERQSVKAVFERLQASSFGQYRMQVLHGQLPSYEKEAILTAFRDGQLDILISTSVVEVGVDIPRATVMVIESAERFGIAQLHQLRGRIGRRHLPATCYLMVREPSDAALARCQRVASTLDGFELAQFDLQQRGPGELVGLAQKGLNPLFLGDLDVNLLETAQRLARENC